MFAVYFNAIKKFIFECMKRIVALITGGFTGEAVVSFRSADFVASNIDEEKYEVYKIAISKDSWYYADNNGVHHPVDKNQFTLTIDGKVIRFETAFIMLHGSPGEDGKLQGYFDMLGIPYTSCDALTSAITMNKGYTKAIVEGIPELYTAKSVQLFENPRDLSEINQLRFPLFIKPNHGGSSIGMSKVSSADELPEALEKAFHEDSQVLVEEFIRGREFSVGIYNGKNGVTALPATEVISSKEFFDYEAKYTPGVTEEITPGRMSMEEKERVERIITAVYERLNCKGMVRIDYFLQYETGDFYFIEINTVPGQTQQSFIPQQVRAAGMSVREFYGELIEKSLQN